MILPRALRHQRAITIMALVLLAVLAWTWIVAGAGMAMDPLVSIVPQSMSDIATPDMPMADMAMGDMPMADIPAPPIEGTSAWSGSRILLVMSMWWVMMIAMMLPAATPTILLYAKAVGASAHVSADGSNGAMSPATGAFLAGYLIVWGGFSVFATLLHMMLDATGLLSAMGMASQSRVLSAIVLIAAGAYQLSPLKEACLNHCRSPGQFLARHYRPGRLGGMRMGVIHGAYCVGCCWLLMALLFVGGVMNLAWIALLTLLVAAEKLLPWGRAVAIVAGLGCIGWGIAILVF
ncbi:DUF2182 domain-containing protein [Croceicoccus ponticola]|uniref:DUF2182 domain-containing protein n=1 Tax=Croceicoccus ponticola TaxID=2217664 RepID=A0A437GZN0_9SPHN|nr:DUF2182 domain-containing protein [Croceicoccus ponticola]RVQ68816.1 DUF2182 domain-containing protein [Croceicoccus ponticola]